MSSISNDLLVEIFSRLPAKSIRRFRCLSKLWCFMYHRPYFTELFLTRYSARPRLLFAVHEYQKSEWGFYSSCQPQNQNDKSSSLVVQRGFRLKFPEDTWSYFCGYASGLICFRHASSPSEKDEGTVHVICNPSTGQYEILPKVGRGRDSNNSRSFLGFDPIDKQFKVLFVGADSSFYGGDFGILTLGTEKMSWRTIQCPLTHKPSPLKGICIDGVLYYIAYDETHHKKIVCFDVRSEIFNFIDNECELSQLINYKGKLGVIKVFNADVSNGRRAPELRMWVLEDVEKQEWSKHYYTLMVDRFSYNNVSVVGVTATGEIVLSSYTTREAFYVFYYNPERNNLQSFEIQGKHEEGSAFCRNSVYAFADHVEDLKFNVMKTTSISSVAHQKSSLNPRPHLKKITITS
ncbi:unnamed protein product [Microthlaspi erraticum]|uniref:F-box domain-containing protein n=1 Tax=Microthlaspi erraticum TaxID=1685480 RepID=A0A6D2L6D7_9BRAS|nr:unnamed protein product [Microthlaspi erraticum]